VVRANRCSRNLAEVGEFRLEALDVETNDAATGEGQRDDAGGAVGWVEFDREQIEKRVLAGLIETAKQAKDEMTRVAGTVPA